MRSGFQRPDQTIRRVGFAPPEEQQFQWQRRPLPVGERSPDVCSGYSVSRAIEEQISSLEIAQIDEGLQGVRREGAGGALGFSFLGFLVSFF